MASTIGELWYGNIVPCEKCGENDEIKDLIALMERNRAVLCGEITVLQQETLDKYIDCSEEYANLISEQAFRKGFCLASKLLCESLFGERE